MRVGIRATFMISFFVATFSTLPFRNAAAEPAPALLKSNIGGQALHLRAGETKNEDGLLGWISLLQTELIPQGVISCFQPQPILSQKPAKPLSVRSSRAAKQVATDANSPTAKIESVESKIVVDALPEEVFAVASAYLDYPKWAGGCQSAKILKDGPDAPELVQFKMGMFGVSMTNTMQYRYEKPRRMTWWVKEGGVKDLLGIYEFKPLSNGRTEVTYKLRVDPGFPLPSFLRKSASRAIASQALKELKKYTEKMKQAKLQEVDGPSEQGSSSITAALRNLVPFC